MLDKPFFKTQLEKLIVEYADKGFTMTKEKASQWYDFMKNIENKEFEKMITNCLLNEQFAPTMATIFKYKQNNTKTPSLDNYKPM